MAFSVVLFEKYSSGDHHWSEFLGKAIRYLPTDLGGAMADKEVSFVGLHLPCTGNHPWLIE